MGANARLINSGQSCIAAKRFIVVKSVAEEFLDEFVSEFQRKSTGDPMNPKTDVGPLVSVQAAKSLDEQVRDSVAKGARIRIGGTQREGKGAFYEPTVLDNVDLNMKVMREEIFGPVAPVYVVQDEDEAIKVANDSEFGLGSSLWTGILIAREGSREKSRAGSFS